MNARTGRAIPRAPTTSSTATWTPRSAGRVWRTIRTRCSTRPPLRLRPRSSAVVAEARGWGAKRASSKAKAKAKS
eukprot:11494060-Alexandrium_andersonii.AAC.1